MNAVGQARSPVDSKTPSRWRMCSGDLTELPQPQPTVPPRPTAQPATSTGRGGCVRRQDTSYLFRFAKTPHADRIHRSAEQGRKCRIKFETDVVNDYFTRALVPGSYNAGVLEGPTEGLDVSHNLVLHDGVANWSIAVPDDIEVGKELTVQCTVTDATLIEPFVNIAVIKVVPQRKRPSGPAHLSRRIRVRGSSCRKSVE